MTKNVFRICSVLALGFASSAMIVAAEESPGPEGVWDVSVTVTDCSDGHVIRVVRSLQMFGHDGSLTETANTASRGISEGAWTHTGRDSYSASYWFFRFKPDGTFLSFAKIADAITLSPDGAQLSSQGTVQDYDATGTLLSTGCFTHTATRLTDWRQPPAHR